MKYQITVTNGITTWTLLPKPGFR